MGLPIFMACKIAHDGEGTTIHLVGQLDDLDFHRIEDGFEQALDRHDRAVVFECSGLEQISSSVRALMGVLHLQARRAGAVIEMRNLGPNLRPLMPEQKETAPTAAEGQDALRLW
jgi:anti-anti-sigma regulatory factor